MKIKQELTEEFIDAEIAKIDEAEEEGNKYTLNLNGIQKEKNRLPL